MATFNDILGYEKQVKELKAICDYLKNTEKYVDFGVKIPEGVLISGDKGVGKTLFANVLAVESERNIWLPLGKSERDINKAIKGAIKNTPSVLIIDDLDYYPESVYPIIDDFLTNLDGEDVFVISTVTDIECLPESLLACRALEKRIILNEPKFEESKLIFKKYFYDKRVENNFNVEDFCYVAQDWSVSMVEDVYNEASIYAVYAGAPTVTIDHIFKAAMKFEEKTITDEFNESTAFHEAGHAAVHLLQGGEAAYIVITEDGGHYVEKKSKIKSYKDRQNDYLVAFAGNACEELFMGESAIGGYTDLGEVSKNIERDNKYLACQGFEYYDSTELNSPAFNDTLAKKVQSDMQSYYDKARKMIEENKTLVVILVEALKKKNYLLHSEIHSIYDKYLIEKRIVNG